MKLKRGLIEPEGDMMAAVAAEAGGNTYNISVKKPKIDTRSNTVSCWCKSF
jgi:hypothetical protein